MMINFIKSKEILLDCLLYPWYAKPEFLIKKQKECDWSKYVFLSSLREVHSHYLALLTRQIHNEKKLNPNIDESKLGLSIETESKGKIKEIFVDYGKRSTVINHEVLQMLIEAIDRANVLGDSKIQYSDLQIITFFETALRFIRHEFEVQAGIKEDSMPFFRSTPKGFVNKTEEGEKVFLLHFYYIKGPEPILDFTVFKHALRNLLLTSPHPEQLTMILQPTIKEVKEIVRIWNEILQPLDAGKGNAVTYRRLIEFQTKKEDWTIWYDDKISNFQESAIRYTNYDLVRFIFDAGNIIANEIADIKVYDSNNNSDKSKVGQTHNNIASKSKKINNVKPPEQIWRGSNEQKERLFDGLVSNSFVLDLAQNKSDFLTGSPIQWQGTFVLLIYLLDLLKPKYINTFDHLQNIVDKNFVGKNNQPLGSTRQSKYNMGNNRKAPKGAKEIKAIIDSI